MTCETCAYAKPTKAEWSYFCTFELPPFISMNRLGVVHKTARCDLHKPKE